MEGCPKALMINFDLKEISSIEEDAFEKPLSAYIQEYYNEDPKQYSKEIQQITQLRKGLSSIPRDKNGCNALRKYYTQLHYLQSRFPMASGGVASVPFIWHDIYSGEPCIYNDVRYEQACLLFNLGGLYSQLGANESRLTDESMKVACTHFQNAAGVYTYVKDNFLLSEMPDMTDEILSLKVAVMLGQSLECILEKSIRDDKNQSLIARICMQVKSYFNEAIDLLNHNGTSEMGSYLRKSWVKHLKIKVYCYEALAYSYMSNDAVKKEQYGHQVSYLKHANEQINEASKLLKNQSDRVVEMVNFVMDVVGNKHNAAVKDNDFIYHMTIPEYSALEEIKPVNFVKPLPFTYDDTTISGPDIFQKLIPLRAHEASSIYSEKKAEILRNVTASIQEKDMQLSGYMSALKIEDLIDPKDDSLPDELIAKNKFLQDNPDLISKVEKDIEELAIKASKLDNLYSELKEKLQNEKEEQNDVELPQELKVLFDELVTCEDAHLKASKTNNELVKHYNESKPMIQFLSGSPASILQSLPSQNVVEAPTDEPVVQRIREILSKVDKMKNQRMKLLSQLREELNKDDITALLAVRDQGEKESFFEEQIKKHDERVGYVNQNLAAQSNIIQALTEANAKYATTREKTSAISAQFDMKVKSYVAVTTLFIDVKDRIRSGLDFYKQLEDNVTLLETKINSYCESQDKKRPKKPSGGKGPPARPTARKPDIMKTAAIPPSQHVPFSNNTMMHDPRFMPQQPVDGKNLPTLNKGQQQFPIQPYATPGAPHPSIVNTPLQPSPFNLNNTQRPQPNIPPADPAHSIHQVPEQRFPIQPNQVQPKQPLQPGARFPSHPNQATSQQNQVPPKHPLQPGTRFPSHPNPATSNVGIPPQANNSFNQPRQTSQTNISTQDSIGQNKHANPLAPQNMYNRQQYSGPYNSKNNIQRLMQNYQPNSPSNPPTVVAHPHPPAALQHHPVTHPHAAGTNLQAQQLPPHQGQSHQISPQHGTLPMQLPPSQTLQQPSPISTGLRKVQVNAHQLPTQQQTTVVSQYPNQQQQQTMQSRFPSQSSTPQQPPANYQYPPKGIVPPQPITQTRYPLQGGNQQAPSQYSSQPTNQPQGLVSPRFPSQSPQYPTNMQQPSVPQFPPPAMPNQQQIIPQVPFPAHPSNPSQPTTKARFPSQPMGNQSQPQYPITNRQAQFGQQRPIQQTVLQQEQQRKQQEQQLQQQQQKVQQQQQPPLQRQPQQQQPQHNYNVANQAQNYGQNQFRPQSGPPLPMQKNLPIQQNNTRFQQSYQNNVPNLYTQGYQGMGSEPSPIIDLLSDNNSLPLPLMPEKTGEQADKSVNQVLPRDDSSMIFPRSSANYSGISNSPQHNSNVISTMQQIPQTKPVSQTPSYVKQESNELIYPRQHSQEHHVTSYEANRSYPSHTEYASNRGMVQSQTNQKPPIEGQTIVDRNLQIAIPSSPQNLSTIYNEPHQVDYQNRITSPMPYSGPSITQSNSAKHSGLLFASKPMMSPTMTPPHDPVISNILGKNIMPNIDITQIAQLNFQQIHLQSMVLQQQQLISMLQTQQNQQRSEEENKIQLLQQQIAEQQKLIEHIKDQKEKEDKNVELQALIDYEKLIKKIHTEEQAKKEKDKDEDETKQPANVLDNGSKGNLQRDSTCVAISPSSKCIPTYSSTNVTPGMTNKNIESGITEHDDIESFSKSTAEGKSVIINANVLPDVLNLGKENSSNSSISTVLSDVISDSVPNGNVTVNNHVPFYEPKLDIKVDDDELSLILPRDMEENIPPMSNEVASVINKPVSDDDEDIIQPRSGDVIIQPRSGDDNIQPHSGDDNIRPRSGDNTVQPSGGIIDGNLMALESVGDKANIEHKAMDSTDSFNETSNGILSSSRKDRKHFSDGSVFSSPSPSKKSTPNTSRCSSKKSTPNTSGRSSPALNSNSQGVQLDDMDNKERKISEAVDHRHLARQLGRMSFYVGGPEETVWLRYIQELDIAVTKLHTLCKNLCKRVENMDIDGFLKIWNDLAKVEELDVRNFSSSAGESNISKNRYRDILPWDHTRVKLLSTENDYINANSIQNLTPHSPHYIATQGPIPQTFSDFWTLVWEQKCQIIVMLTNEVEGTKLKCHHYWGREVDSRIEFDNLILILMDEMTTSGWKIRTFTMIDKKCEDIRMVKQFQFTSWPDYGTPESPYELLTFMEDIYQCHQQLDSTFNTPIILHCSAGVGRTGSFCCIYSAIREMQGQNGLIDIPGVIRKLRQYRPHMVQRKEQLIFCYQAVLCFAQQFTAAETHKISNPKYQDDSQLLMDISNEQNSHKNDIESSKKEEPSDSNLSNGTADNSINQFPMGATSRDYSQESELLSDQGGDNVSGNSKFKINSGIFQSTRTSCMEQSNNSDNLKSEEE